MGVPLDPKLAEKMRERARAVKERLNSGFTRGWSLTGKSAVVEAGKEVIVRLGPRWDYATNPKYIRRVLNPEYAADEIYVYAADHWWDGEEGRRIHEWCVKSVDPDGFCPICFAAADLKRSGSKEDRDLADDIRAHDVFLYNALIGSPRRLVDGKPDWRYLAASPVVYDGITDIMTGGDTASFARGDISDPREGFDLKLSRPAANARNVRWKVDCAPDPSPLYGQDQKDAFKGWPSLLVNLEDLLKKEIKSPEELFKLFWGRSPGLGELGEQEGYAEEEPEETATQRASRLAKENPVDDDDGVMPAPRTKPATQPVMPAPRTLPESSGPGKSTSLPPEEDEDGVYRQQPGVPPVLLPGDDDDDDMMPAPRAQQAAPAPASTPPRRGRPPGSGRPAANRRR